MRINKKQKTILGLVAIAVIVVTVFAFQNQNLFQQNVFNTTNNVSAASGSVNDIQTAVNQAATQGGGTVHIPAGTWVWNNGAVNIPAGVSVIGAGSAGCSGQ